MIFVVNVLLQIYFKLTFDYSKAVDRGNVVLNSMKLQPLECSIKTGLNIMSHFMNILLCVVKQPQVGESHANSDPQLEMIQKKQQRIFIMLMLTVVKSLKIHFLLDCVWMYINLFSIVNRREMTSTLRCTQSSGFYSVSQAE